MDLDATFRPYVVAGFFLVILIVLPFRLKSQATREKLDRTQEGVPMMIGLRLAGLALWAGVIAFMIDPRVMAWSSIALPAEARWAGVGLTIVTAALLTWTLRSLGPNLTDTVVTRTAHALVTQGPYRWVRHPFYDCMALFMLAIALMTANWFVMVGGAVVFALLAIRSRTEEKKLLERFGAPYRASRAATGRFLPTLPVIFALWLLATASASASGREGEGLADAVRLIVLIVLAAFIASTGAGAVHGAFRSRQKGESILKGSGRGVLRGLAAFLVLAFVSIGGLTVLGIIWVAYSLVVTALQ